jgi:hypothetical protein
MWCAACSKQVDDKAPFCDACGAALGPRSQRARTVAASLGSSTNQSTPRGTADGRRHAAFGVATTLLALFVAVLWWPRPPEVSADALQTAMRIAIARGDSPGRDPICVANGLAYDQEPVNVEIDNAATVSWMNILVAAGLYAAPANGVSGGAVSQALLVYQPLPSLADWAGGRGPGGGPPCASRAQSSWKAWPTSVGSTTCGCVASRTPAFQPTFGGCSTNPHRGSTTRASLRRWHASCRPGAVHAGNRRRKDGS